MWVWVLCVQNNFCKHYVNAQIKVQSTLNRPGATSRSKSRSPCLSCYGATVLKITSNLKSHQQRALQGTPKHSKTPTLRPQDPAQRTVSRRNFKKWPRQRPQWPPPALWYWIAATTQPAPLTCMVSREIHRHSQQLIIINEKHSPTTIAIAIATTAVCAVFAEKLLALFLAHDWPALLG